MTGRKITFVAIFCSLVGAISACSRSPRVNFYTLTADASPVAVSQIRSGYSVSVDPVSLPELVDRSQLVIRAESNQVDILETERWAEPLKSQIPRLLADNLGKLLASDRVSAYPQSIGSEADYRIVVDIRSFEAAGDRVSVDAFWAVRRSGGALVKTGRSVIREPVGTGGTDSLVKGYSRALSAISNEIAAAIGDEARRN